MMKRVLAAGGVAVLVAGLGFGLALYRDALAHRGRIQPGVSITGIPVGGLTPELARRRVEAVVAERLARTLGIRAGGPIARPTLADLGVRAAYDEAINAAFAVGREANPVRRLQTRWRLRQGIDVPLRFVQDEQTLRAVVTRLAAAVAAEPRDARVTVVDDAVVITEASVDGRTLDVQETVARIKRAVADEAGAVEAVGRITRPPFTIDDALTITGPIARYRTKFVNIPNRNHNIALAAGKLRGVLILPGEVLSYNQTVGPRTPELGYLPAPVLLNNILVPGDGGGVCQVSSTLFNVALLADLAILERHDHTPPVAYLPPPPRAPRPGPRGGGAGARPAAGGVPRPHLPRRHPRRRGGEAGIDRAQRLHSAAADDPHRGEAGDRPAGGDPVRSRRFAILRCPVEPAHNVLDAGLRRSYTFRKCRAELIALSRCGGGG